VLRWYALAAHAGNLALFVLIHGGEAALGPVCASIFFAACAHNHQLKRKTLKLRAGGW
jgi:hypothetical protein